MSNLVSSQNILYHEVELSKWLLVLQVCDMMVELLRKLPDILYNHAWGQNQISYELQSISRLDISLLIRKIKHKANDKIQGPSI